MDLQDSLEATLDDMARVPALAALRRYGQGELLYRQGSAATHVFWVKTGRVRVHVLAADGRDRTLLIAGPGSALNDADFYLQRAASASAEALDAVAEAYKVSRAGFTQLLASQPALAECFLESLARETLRLTEEVVSLSFEDVRGRVQLALIRLANDHGVVTPQGVAIDLRVTHEDMSRLVGANRATVSACLSDLHRGGFYEVVRQRIVLAPWAAGQILPP
jgi:CRP/FNR family transcriptional regulator